MDIVKTHVFVTIAATQAASLFFTKLPYYPTEVSRMAASGPVPDAIFKAGLFGLVITLYLNNALNQQTGLLWTSLIAIAAFDTVRYPVIHLAGVGALMSAAAYATYCKGRHAMIPLFAAFSIYIFRVALKVLVVFFYEMSIKELNIWSFTQISLYRELFDKGMAISTYGAEACNFAPERVIPIFQLCGVLQWTVFYALSFLF